MKQQTNLQTEEGNQQPLPSFHVNRALAKFRAEFTRNIQTNLINQHVLTILTDPNWVIRDNYHQQNWNAIFSYLLQSYCRRFFLTHTFNDQVIIQISRIKFQCLKHLDLQNNKISNIQGLSFLKIPIIKSLVLRNNQILSIQTVGKSRWKHIQSIDFQFNSIKEWRRPNALFINRSNQYFSLQFIQCEKIEQNINLVQTFCKLQFLNNHPLNLSNLESYVKDDQKNYKQEGCFSRIKLGKKVYQVLKSRIK